MDDIVASFLDRRTMASDFSVNTDDPRVCGGPPVTFVR
jgi:hypothetical protein